MTYNSNVFSFMSYSFRVILGILLVGLVFSQSAQAGRPANKQRIDLGTMSPPIVNFPHLLAIISMFSYKYQPIKLEATIDFQPVRG